MALTALEYGKIERIYDEKRLQEEALLFVRKKEVEEKVPGYKDLESESISLAMEKARMLIGHSLDEAETAAQIKSLQQKLFDLQLAKKNLLKEAGYARDYLEPHYECPACRDTGFVEGEKCTCFKKLEVSFLYEMSHLKDFLEANNFDNMTDDYFMDEKSMEDFHKALSTARRFIEDFDKGGQNLFFYGSVGTGKSFLSGCIAKELLDREVPVVYFSAVQLFQILSTYHFDSNKQPFYMFTDTLYNSPLLIIDDLGCEYLNDFVRSNLFQIINERILRKKSTIISTNKSLEEIREHYSDRVLSRITGCYDLLHLTGTDLRQQIAIERKLGTRS